MELKALFEKWVVQQFGESTKILLVEFDEEDGYPDQDINTMWLSFNAGVLLADQVD